MSESLLEPTHRTMRWDEVKLSEEERRTVLRRHYRRDTIFTENPRRPFVEVKDPFCGGCGEPWGDYGCPSVRALACLLIAEHERTASARKISALEEALGQLGVRGSVRPEEDRDTWVARLMVHGVLMRGGHPGVISATLERLAKECSQAMANLKTRPASTTTKTTTRDSEANPNGA